MGALVADLDGALVGWLSALALGAAWVSLRGRVDRTPVAGAAAVPAGLARAVRSGPAPGATVPGGPAVGRDVSVVVCCYDMARYEQLLDCLDSVHRQSLAPESVVVVVDGCPQLARALRHRAGPEQLVVLDTNQGLSAARNAGAARVTTAWVAFLDDDATAAPDWLAKLTDCALEWGAVGAGGWSAPVFDGPAPRWLPPELLWTVGCSYRGMRTERAMQRNVFGGCAVLRTAVFRQVGGYDVTLGRRGGGVEGGEEADFSLRVAAAHPTAYFAHVPDAVIHHRVGTARLTRGYVLSRCFSDGRTKRLLAARVGRRALGSERAYVLTAVPRGVLRGLVAGRWESAAILTAGVGSAALGYLAGRVRSSRRRDDRLPAGGEAVRR